MPPQPDPAPSLRHRGASSAQPHPQPQPQPQPTQPPTNQQQPQPHPNQPQNQNNARSRAVAGAMGLGLVTAAVGGTYLLSDNQTVFPFAVAACLATFSSVLLHFALAGVNADGNHRVRARHFRAHRHFTGERAAYVRTSHRLAMMDRDFTDADYELLLDLDNNSQRLRRFLEGASHEMVARLPTYIYKKPRREAGRGEGESGKEGSQCGDAADGDGAKCSQKSEGVDDTMWQCAICLEDFEEGMKIRILPCLHRFMAECIDPWLEQQAKCPVCKRNIQEDMNAMPEEVMNALPPGCN